MSAERATSNCSSGCWNARKPMVFYLRSQARIYVQVFRRTALSPGVAQDQEILQDVLCYGWSARAFVFERVRYLAIRVESDRAFCFGQIKCGATWRLTFVAFSLKFNLTYKST